MPTAKKKPAKPVKTVRSARPAPVARPNRAAVPARKMATPVPPKPRWSEQYERAVKEYAAALEKAQGRQWAEARPLLEAIIRNYGEEADLLDITDRARSYLRACERHLADAERPGSDPFLLGVYHGNRGEHDEAIRMFERALAATPDSDKILYALAEVRAQKGDRSGAIDSLRRAIRLDDRNRVYALNDADFDPVRDEPEFIDLVEPEEAGGQTS